MAHIMKIQKPAVSNMLHHFNNDRHTREGRDNIDKDRIDLNYTLTFRDDDMSDKEFLEHRLSQLEYRERRDTVEMCSVCISLPKDYHGDRDAFFECCFRFVGDRYGYENIIGGYVHRDEWNEKTHEPIQDHIHIPYIPVVDRDKEVERLNAKEHVSRAELRSFHKDLERNLEREHIHARVLNGATRDQREYIRDLEHSKEFYEREHQNDREVQERYDKYMAQQRDIDRDIDRQTREENDHDRDRDRDRDKDRDRE